MRGREEISGIAARLNYLSPDRMDIGFAVKEAARNISKPLIGDWAKLNRIGRYLVGRPRLVSLFGLYRQRLGRL